MSQCVWDNFILKKKKELHKVMILKVKQQRQKDIIYFFSPYST